MIEIQKHPLYKYLDLDTVLSSVLKIYFKKFFVLFISSFIAVFAVQFTLYKMGFMELYNISDPEEAIRALSGLMGKIGLVFGISAIIYGLLNTFLISYIFKSDIEPDINYAELIGESFGKYAIHMIFFMVLSAIIFIVGAFMGILVFIVGVFLAALYLLTVLMPGMSIVVAEEKNAIDAIGRTFSLSHKDFWSNLGIIVVFILIMILISLIMAALVAVPFLIMFFENFRESGNFLEALNIQNYDLGVWTIVINSFVSALTYPLYAVLSVVLYFKLRYIEDQKNIQQ